MHILKGIHYNGFSKCNRSIDLNGIGECSTWIFYDSAYSLNMLYLQLDMRGLKALKPLRHESLPFQGGLVIVLAFHVAFAEM